MTGGRSVHRFHTVTPIYPGCPARSRATVGPALGPRWVRVPSLCSCASPPVIVYSPLVLSRLEGDRPHVNDGRWGALWGASRGELPAAPGCALEGFGPSGDLEGRVYAQARGCAVLVVRMSGDRPVVKGERDVLVDDVACPAW